MHDSPNLPLEDLIESSNIAEDLNTEQLTDLGTAIRFGVQSDLDSLKGWFDQVDEWLNLASMMREDKSFPWEGASNIKIPLIAIAATQFAARAYAALLPGEQYVRASTKGKDVDGQKKDRAVRIERHMTWQLQQEMEDWESDMDRMLHILPIVGTAFKKTYFDPHTGKNVSELINPKDFIVNYNAKSLEKAERKTHRVYYTDNQLEEYIRAKIFIRPEKKLEKQHPNEQQFHINPHNITSNVDPVVGMHECYEVHCWEDLDGDGYKEPYIITYHVDTCQVLRIKANFNEQQVQIDENEDVVRIIPTEHFTNWVLIPDPCSAIYGLGFGHLIGTMNEACNSLANQLIDSGTMANMQAGYIGAQLQMDGGDEPFRPGEWRLVNTFGDDLRKQIIPLPLREPSSVLFSLLNMLQGEAMKMASVTEIMTGDIPGQNVKATVAMAAIEQGSKVFSSIYKRCHRSTTKELKKLFYLNSLYLDHNTYVAVLDDEVGPNDYDVTQYDIYPVSDPTISSEQQRLMKVQALGELLPIGINVQEYLKRVLEATEQPNIEALLQPNPDPGPPAEEVRADKELQWTIQKENAELQDKLDQSIHQRRMETLDRQLRAVEIDIKEDSEKAKSILNMAKAAVEQQEADFKRTIEWVEQSRKDQAQALEALKLGAEISANKQDRMERMEGRSNNGSNGNSAG